jgi:hypothetical protein
MWLAPFSGPNSAQRNEDYNTIFILFDEPMTIGLIKIWNYAKTSSRGVKEMEIYLDDVLLYRGCLLASPKDGELDDYDELTIDWGSEERLDLSQAVIFTDNQEIIHQYVSRTLRLHYYTYMIVYDRIVVGNTSTTSCGRYRVY